MRIDCPVSVGEILDKLTILELKLQHITDPAKLANIRIEHDALAAIRDGKLQITATIQDLYCELKAVNQQLWTIEDDIRNCERDQNFGPRFIELARSVYITNDKRAALKQAINRASGSAFIEEKSYTEY